MSGYKVSSTLSLREIYTISRQKFSGGYFFGGESHSYYEAVCVLKGKVGVTAGKNVYVLEQGQMTVHRPHEFHAIWEEGQSEPEVVIFTFEAAPFPKVKGSRYLLSASLLRDINVLYRDAHGIFKMEGELSYCGNTGKTVFKDGMYIKGVNEGMDRSAERFMKRLEVFLSLALESIIDAQPELVGAGSENYARVLSVMVENINENLSASQIASLSGISVPTLEKTVYKYMHCGAVAYYNALRMERAHSLIRHGASIKETATHLGFSNQNYFSACFKKRYGYPPSRLKRNNKE